MHVDHGAGLIQAHVAAYGPERVWWCDECQDQFPAGVPHEHLTVFRGPDTLGSDAPRS